MNSIEFEEYLENISVLDKFKASLPTLQIEWETDPNVDLSVLASEVTIPDPGTVRHIEFIEMSRIEQAKQDLLNGDLIRYLDLFKLIEQGVKIIPPLMIRSISFINGVQETIDAGLIHVSDGYHRVNLAKHLNLQTIPVLFIDQPYKYTFSRSKFEISATETELQLVDKDSRKMFVLELSNVYPGINPNGNYEFFVNI